jgi:hypothetical protein
MRQIFVGRENIVHITLINIIYSASFALNRGDKDDNNSNFQGQKNKKNQQRFLIRILPRDPAPLNCTEVKLLINLGK